MEELSDHLRGVVFYGATAPSLLAHYREVVDLLYPADEHGGLDLDQRALLAEDLIRQAARNVDKRTGAEAASTVLGLAVGTQGRKLLDRRRIAGDFFGVLPGTFRKPQHEGRLMRALAAEIVRILLDIVQCPDPLTT
ncbi:hypothetical protein [Amycolatopsis sp. CA-126428]|uniref:hypothetical protein n=1 Tax=Amycolatopsis sp. CA-126428 TaxID=2073158 RepID=UPI000CD2868C|nr:hypothetical protein [Amycolatopsis sp. CA-126428]